jgi:hypothetical protein
VARKKPMTTLNILKMYNYFLEQARPLIKRAKTKKEVIWTLRTSNAMIEDVISTVKASARNAANFDTEIGEIRTMIEMAKIRIPRLLQDAENWERKTGITLNTREADKMTGKSKNLLAMIKRRIETLKNMYPEKFDIFFDIEFKKFM